MARAHAAEKNDREKALDSLFRASPSEFVAVRKKIVADLKTAGDKATADLVAAAHKPTSTAWAINQVVLRHPDAVASFTEAVEAMRTAQRGLLEAKAADAASVKTKFAAARTELVKRSNELVQIAKKELEAEKLGWNPTVQRRIAQTLSTLPLAAADDVERVLAGRLEKDLTEASEDGFFAAALGPVDDEAIEARRQEAKHAPAPSHPHAKTPAKHHDADDKKKAREAAQREREEAEARAVAERRLKALEKTAKDADDDVADLERAVERAETMLKKTRIDHDEAKKKAKAAHEAVAAAKRDLR
ncbi:MAG TPA: hypothetical protein VF407_04475 [Polyangiaceae bacterium]